MVAYGHGLGLSRKTLWRPAAALRLAAMTWGGGGGGVCYVVETSSRLALVCLRRRWVMQRPGVVRSLAQVGTPARTYASSLPHRVVPANLVLLAHKFGETHSAAR